MRHRAAAWLAWSIWAVVLATLVFTLVFGAPGSVDHWTQIPVLVTFTLFVLAFSTVGALIASRRARNPIGWIMCASAIAYAAGGVGAATAQTPGGDRRGGRPGSGGAKPQPRLSSRRKRSNLR